MKGKIIATIADVIVGLIIGGCLAAMLFYGIINSSMKGF